MGGSFRVMGILDARLAKSWLQLGCLAYQAENENSKNYKSKVNKTV